MPVDSERRAITLDTECPDRLIAVSSRLLAGLTGQVIADGNTPQRAEAKRMLHYVADMLERAAAEVRVLHHKLNGFEDPLDD